MMMPLSNFCGFRSAKQMLLLSAIFLSLLASGTSRYRYERPSRVVEIKQGRLQGTLVEVPLLSTVTSSTKTQVNVAFVLYLYFQCCQLKTGTLILFWSVQSWQHCQHPIKIRLIRLWQKWLTDESGDGECKAGVYLLDKKSSSLCRKSQSDFIFAKIHLVFCNCSITY